MRQETVLDIKRRASDLKTGGDYAGALRLRQELDELYQQWELNGAERTGNLNFIAFLAVHAGDLDEAELAARKCLELYRATSDECGERLATYVMILSFVLAEAGKFEEAIARGEEAIALFAKAHAKGSGFVEDRRRDVERMRNKDAGPYLDK